MGLPRSAVIQTITGPLSVEQFAARCLVDPDFHVPVFSWDGLRITVGLASKCRPTGEEQLFSVVLDDGSELAVGASTAFLLRSGDEALSPAELSRGDSLLPLYLSEDKQGYPTYKNVGLRWPTGPKIDRQSVRKISRMVAEWKHGAPLPAGTYVEHIDGDRKNCHPDNLRIVHKPAKASRSKRYGLVDALKEAADVVREFEQIRPKRLPNNHSVCDVTPMEMDVVYDLTVDTGNVIVLGGVFVRLNLC